MTRIRLPLVLGSTLLAFACSDPSGRSLDLDDLSLTTSEDVALEYDLPVDGAGVSITYDPPFRHGTVVGEGAHWSYTPALDFHGTDEATVTVSSPERGSVTATVRIVVTPVNDAPVAYDDSLSAEVDTPRIVTEEELVMNDVDVDGDRLTVASVAATDDLHGTVALVDGTLTFTPAAGFRGDATFVYTVTDPSGASDEAEVRGSVGIPATCAAEPTLAGCPCEGLGNAAPNPRKESCVRSCTAACADVGQCIFGCEIGGIQNDDVCTSSCSGLGTPCLDSCYATVACIDVVYACCEFTDGAFEGCP